MVVFWVVKRMDLQADTNVSEEHTAYIFRAKVSFSWLMCPKDGGNMFLRNGGICILLHTALQPRRPTLTSSSIGRGYDNVR
jgi:hypothetical protein